VGIMSWAGEDGQQLDNAVGRKPIWLFPKKLRDHALASEGRGNSGSCDGSCWELLLIDRDHG